MGTEKIKAFTASEALNEIGRAARLFKAFEHAHEVMEYMAGLEQRERELTDRIASLAKQNADADAKLAATQAEAVKTEQAANDRAESIVAAALDRQIATEERARQNAQVVQEAAIAEAGKARAALEAVNAEARDAEARRDRALADASDAERRLAAAKQEIDRLLKG